MGKVKVPRKTFWFKERKRKSQRKRFCQKNRTGRIGVMEDNRGRNSRVWSNAAERLKSMT